MKWWLEWLYHLTIWRIRNACYKVRQELYQWASHHTPWTSCLSKHSSAPHHWVLCIIVSTYCKCPQRLFSHVVTHITGPTVTIPARISFKSKQMKLSVCSRLKQLQCKGNASFILLEQRPRQIHGRISLMVSNSSNGYNSFYTGVICNAKTNKLTINKGILLIDVIWYDITDALCKISRTHHVL